MALTSHEGHELPLSNYFASLLIASGLDVKTMRARMRHASAKTTLDTYGHLWPDIDESSRAAVDIVYMSRTAARRAARSTPAQAGD